MEVDSGGRVRRGPSAKTIQPSDRLPEGGKPCKPGRGRGITGASPRERRAGGITWLAAHVCLSVQSLWLRTYHHWISSE